jgi:deoxyribodipyrimidine photo-lyase
MVDQRRVQIKNEYLAGSGPVLYVMAREQRVQDNWALLYAQEQAVERNVPLLVLFALGPMFASGTARHNAWMVASLKEVQSNLQKHNIPFYIEIGEWKKVIPGFVNQHKVGEIVFDFNPLQPVRGWRDVVTSEVTCRVSEVDARNVVPVWQASDKLEYAAYTIRPKINKQLREYLTPVPELEKQSKSQAKTLLDTPINWSKVESYRSFAIEAPIPDTFTPGEAAGQEMLEDFITNRLPGYNTNRNDPNEEGVSHLSPYLRWGNISAQRIALAVKQSDAPAEDKDAFLEELIVRRELSDNFVYYNPEYDKVAGAHAWAQKTISEHVADKREYVYSLEQFERAETHDDLWNAAQLQMVQTGKMHGYLRMYWAKKILEWTSDAQEAIDVALTLNDRYELDGRDSNGVCGVMWSICGVHDRAWTERDVFGKIRYMNYNGCKRKFDVKAYVTKHTDDQELLFND